VGTANGSRTLFGLCGRRIELLPLLGGLEIIGAALLVLLVGLFLYGHRVLAGRIPAAFVLTSVLELAMKFYLPQVPVPQGAPQVEGYAPLVVVDHTYRYPSGHVIRSVIVFGALLLLSRNRFLRAGLLVVLGGIAASRAYIGVHWSSDALGEGTGGPALLWAFSEDLRMKNATLPTRDTQRDHAAVLENVKPTTS